MASSFAISLTDWKMLSSDRGYVFSRVLFILHAQHFKSFFLFNGQNQSSLLKHFFRPKGGGGVTRIHLIPLLHAPLLTHLVPRLTSTVCPELNACAQPNHPLYLNWGCFSFSFPVIYDQVFFIRERGGGGGSDRRSRSQRPRSFWSTPKSRLLVASGRTRFFVPAQMAHVGFGR